MNNTFGQINQAFIRSTLAKKEKKIVIIINVLCDMEKPKESFQSVELCNLYNNK